MNSFPRTLTARVLRNFGFTRDEDFTVLSDGARTVVAFQGRAHTQAAYNADQIEREFRSAGVRVNVNFTRTPSGGFHTHIALSGGRQRQGHFMDTYADQLALGLVESPDRAAEAVKAAEDAFPVGTEVCTVDPTWGLVQGRVIESTPIVVDTPGHRNEGRVKVLVCWTAATHTYTKWAFTDTLSRI